MDRATAQVMRREFKDDVRDLVESFISVGEQAHGDTLKFWLQFETQEEVLSKFSEFLTRKVKSSDPD